MLRLSAIFLILSSFFALPARTQAQAQDNTASTSAESSGAIRGTVLDPDGKAVPRASVTLLKGDEALEQGQSDDRGLYSFTTLPSGTYRVAASAAGLAATTGDIALQPGEERHLDLPLALSAVDQQVVVSASLGDLISTEIGSSLSVVPQEQIVSQDAQTLSDAIREVPGLAEANAGRRGGLTNVYIRGGDSKYNLVMVDGIPLNDFGGDFPYYALLPIDGVDHVEVVRGSQSALYGPDAVTGVIDLVTEAGEGPPSFNAVMEGGSFGTYRLATGGSGDFRGFNWSYDLSRLSSDGVVPNDDYQSQSAFVTLGFSRSPKRQLIFHFFGDANNAGAPGPYGSDPDQLFPGIDTVSRDKQNLFGYQASETEQINPRLRQVSTVSVATDRFYFSSPSGDSFSNNLHVVANTRSEVTLASTDVLVAGGEANREQYEDTYVANSDNAPFVLPRTSLALFVENRWNPSRRWSLVTGIRVDDIHTNALPPDAFGERPPLPATTIAQVNPRGTISYVLRQGGVQSLWGETRLHASGGTGIRPPDGFDLGFTDNPHLKPERSITTDAGVTQRFFDDRAVLDFTYFYNRFKDQIVTLGASLQNLSMFTSDNLNNSEAQGMEVSLRLQPTRSLEIATSYTWLNTRILALDGSTLAQSPFQVGQPLIRRPRNSAGLDATWQRGRLRLNANGFARSATLDSEPNYGYGACSIGLPCLFRDHGYVLANAGLGFRTFHNAEVFGQLNNFLNQKYEEVFGYPAYRLNFMAGIRLQFQAERGGSHP